LREAFIQFENVEKAFGRAKVLDGLSFEIKKGEIVCVTGPSGTGKSVTLKHIVGLECADAGRVLVDGVDVAECSKAELAALRSRMGYLFQSGALLAWMTVAENVALPLVESTRMGRGEIEAKTMAALKAVGLEAAAEKYPAQISGGMQKRAGLARAIVREAEIVLYDEPTSGLDPVTAETIHALIKRLNRERGITSVVVTHDLAAALAISDRVMLVKDGRVVEFATPEDFRNSEKPEVRRFLAAATGTTL